MAEDAGFPEDLELQVRRVTRSVAGRSALPEDLVERTVRQCLAERQDARIKDFVGLLAEREARERLRRLTAGAPEPSTV